MYNVRLLEGKKNLFTSNGNHSIFSPSLINLKSGRVRSLSHTDSVIIRFINNVKVDCMFSNYSLGSENKWFLFGDIMFHVLFLIYSFVFVFRDYSVAKHKLEKKKNSTLQSVYNFPTFINFACFGQWHL